MKILISCSPGLCKIVFQFCIITITKDPNRNEKVMKKSELIKLKATKIIKMLQLQLMIMFIISSYKSVILFKSI